MLTVPTVFQTPESMYKHTKHKENTACMYTHTHVQGHLILQIVNQATQKYQVHQNTKCCSCILQLQSLKTFKKHLQHKLSHRPRC